MADRPGVRQSLMTSTMKINWEPLLLETLSVQSVVSRHSDGKLSGRKKCTEED